ncbi:hypothetical protein ABZZ01_17270 [Streptomyces virginiae]|uniref:hypothetical protein n=1 Tax=Streptomyces virginiae TaxID=1961 RepID=UPI0033B16363
MGLLAMAATLLSASLGPLLQLFGIKSGPVAAALLLLAVLIGGIVAVRKAFADRPNMSRRARWLSVAGLGGFLVACTTLVIVFQPHPPPPELLRLPGAQDVAVVGFEGVGAGQDQRVLDDVSEVFTTDLMKDQLPEGSRAHDYARVTSPPLEVLGKAGQDHQELDDWTNGFVEQTNAGIVIGGLVTTDSAGQTGLRPAVYVRAAQVDDAPELAGWYLSGQIRLDQDWSSDTGRRHVITELVRRTRGLADFTHALDLWRNGKVNDAKQVLDQLLPSGAVAVRQDGAEFVTPDLVRLFHGHALDRAGCHRPPRGSTEAVPRGGSRRLPGHRPERPDRAAGTPQLGRRAVPAGAGPVTELPPGDSGYQGTECLVGRAAEALGRGALLRGRSAAGVREPGPGGAVQGDSADRSR